MFRLCLHYVYTIFRLYLGAGGGGSDPPGGDFSLGQLNMSTHSNDQGKIRLMKLPAVTFAEYAWDGDSSTLHGYIPKWHAELGQHSSNESIPFLRQLVPKRYCYLLNNLSTLKACLKALKVLLLPRTYILSPSSRTSIGRKGVGTFQRTRSISSFYLSRLLSFLTLIRGSTCLPECAVHSLL